MQFLPNGKISKKNCKKIISPKSIQFKNNLKRINANNFKIPYFEEFGFQWNFAAHECNLVKLPLNKNQTLRPLCKVSQFERVVKLCAKPTVLKNLRFFLLKKI